MLVPDAPGELWADMKARENSMRSVEQAADTQVGDASIAVVEISVGLVDLVAKIAAGGVLVEQLGHLGNGAVGHDGSGVIGVGNPELHLAVDLAREVRERTENLLVFDVKEFSVPSLVIG